jgi:hypothetical protein
MVTLAGAPFFPGRRWATPTKPHSVESGVLSSSFSVAVVPLMEL